MKSRFQKGTPVFLVSQVAATMRWYKEKLGFSGRGHPKSQPYAFAILEKDDVTIMLQALEDYDVPDLYDQRDGGVWHAYIRVQGIRVLFEELSKDGGVTIVEGLEHQPHGDTTFAIRDFNGYVLVFAQYEGGEETVPLRRGRGRR
jgi:uncharacterized glyoxalase superfamily protein PhnB